MASFLGLLLLVAAGVWVVFSMKARLGGFSTKNGPPGYEGDESPTAVCAVCRLLPPPMSLQQDMQSRGVAEALTTRSTGATGVVAVTSKNRLVIGSLNNGGAAMVWQPGTARVRIVGPHLRNGQPWQMASAHGREATVEVDVVATSRSPVRLVCVNSVAQQLVAWAG